MASVEHIVTEFAVEFQSPFAIFPKFDAWFLISVQQSVLCLRRAIRKDESNGNDGRGIKNRMVIVEFYANRLPPRVSFTSSRLCVRNSWHMEEPVV